MEARIKPEIIQYPYGEEWMVGKTVKVLEQFPEDGMQYALIELLFCGTPGTIRLPMKYLEVVDTGDHRPVDVRITDAKTGKKIMEEKPAVVEKIEPILEAIGDSNKFRGHPDAPIDTQCRATAKSGKRCKKEAIESGYCIFHAGNKRK